MIYQISANNPKFRSVQFKEHFNVILADAATNSDEKDSRNGLGKSSIIEIVHFCLGSNLKKGVGLGKKKLSDWTFSMEFDLGKEKVIVHRNTKKDNQIFVDGLSQNYGISPRKNDKTGEKYFIKDDWLFILGRGMFNLPSDKKRKKYDPTFRMLIPYFIRRGRDGFLSPFQYFKTQKTWQTQVTNSFLLGLSWEYAQEWQKIKDQEEGLKQLKAAVTSGVVSEFLGTLGNLEAQKLRFDTKVDKEKEQLDSFRVHPQYEEIEREVNSLTQKIHDFVNKNMSDSRMIEHYEKSIDEERLSETTDIEKIYKQAGINFSSLVKKRFEDVVIFHKQIIKNRKDYLIDEINRLKRAVKDCKEEIEEASNLRASRMEILKKHGALDEYNKLSSRHLEAKSELENIKKKISSLKQFEQSKSVLKIEKEELKQKARRDYDEKEKIRSKAIGFFNDNSEALYNSPGEFIINITENGFNFRVEIARADSNGVSLMKIFCYDLMLAQIWAEKILGPKLLFHDSSIFADVDERQIASAIQEAAKAAKEYNFQYICCLNSDKIPHDLLEKNNFNLNNHVNLRLKDDKPESSLFGFRF